MTETLKATVYPYRPGIGYGNIVWAERDRGSSYYRVSRFAGRNGRFPPRHPVAPGSQVFGGRDSQCGASEALSNFRARGYWASCFPEGDGITWKPLNGQSDAQCVTDIRECFPMLTVLPNTMTNNDIRCHRPARGAVCVREASHD